MIVQPDLFSEPLVRVSDPGTSRAAAESAKGGNQELITRIRRVAMALGPLTAFEIAEKVEELEPGRWSEGTIRTACSRAGLTVIGTAFSPRGQLCRTFRYIP